VPGHGPGWSKEGRDARSRTGLEQESWSEGSRMSDRTPECDLAVLRDLLVDAFDPDGFCQLFFFSDNPRLKPLYKLLSPNATCPSLAWMRATG
jgi:hypothetical protein